MLIAGVDEVGRGALCGNVVAAVVVLPEDFFLPGLRDSKKCTEKARARLFARITESATVWRYAQASPREIDALNIHHATLLAMQRALLALPFVPDAVIVDGRFVPAALPFPARAQVGGDALIPAISAASIVAKVVRDQQLALLDRCYPHYDLARNKGYPTPRHRQALQQWGPTPVHRLSYAPVQGVS